MAKTKKVKRGGWNWDSEQPVQSLSSMISNGYNKVKNAVSPYAGEIYNKGQTMYNNAEQMYNNRQQMKPNYPVGGKIKTRKTRKGGRRKSGATRKRGGRRHF